METFDEAVDETISADNELEETLVNDLEEDAGDADSEEVVFDDTIGEDHDKISKTKAFSKRLNEERAKIAKAEEDKTQAKLDEVAKERGFGSWSELEEYDRREKIESLGIVDGEAFDKVLSEAISKNPIVQDAKKIVESNMQKEQFEVIDAAISEIGELDPDIKSIDDILSMDKYDDLFDLVKKGASLVDAYKVVELDKIAEYKVKNITKDKITNMNSKNHLKSVKGGGSSSVTVPEDILAHYKKNNPNMTEDDIRKHYNDYINN